MKILEFKSFNIVEKKADDSGNLIISGYGATFEDIDAGDDQIKKGAFTKTLIERKGRIAFCFQHDIFNAVGKILEIYEDDKGLFLSVMISAAEEDLQIKIKEDIYKEMSIGYRAESYQFQQIGGKQIRVITEIKLFEVSIVTIAMNQYARVNDMKSEEQKNIIEKEFDRVLAIVRNENINFEILKLKSLVLSIAPEAQTPPKVEKPQMKAAEMLKLLNS